MKKIHTPQEYAAMQNSEKKSAALWSTKWCPDCVYIKPFLPDLEKEFPEIEFYEIDRDELLDLGIEEKILGIPSFIVYQDGQEKGRFVSKLRKTREEIEAFLHSVS